MNRVSQVRLYETGITMLGSYLALNSFFESSLYRTIGDGVSQILNVFNIQTISSSQIGIIIPILVTLMVSLVILYDVVMGKPEDILDLHQINLMLIIPETLSHSRLDWMNLIQRPQILEPTRAPIYVFFSGAVIFLGYITLYFISLSREDGENLRNRSVDESEIEHLFIKQTKLVILIALASTILVSMSYVSLEPLTAVLLSFLGGLPFGYILFGLPGVALLILAIWVFLKNEEVNG